MSDLPLCQCILPRFGPPIPLDWYATPLRGEVRGRHALSAQRAPPLISYPSIQPSRGPIPSPETVWRVRRGMTVDYLA
jgi:hypothetical protein